MADIILYPGQASPNDIKLRTPTAVPTSTIIAVPVLDFGPAPTRPAIYYQTRVDPLDVAPVVVATTEPEGWQAPLSGAPAVAQAFYVSYDLPSVLATTPQGWTQELSRAPAVAKARAGFADVPYNTAQVSVNFTVLGWTQALSVAPPTAKAKEGFGSVPFNTAQRSVNFTAFGWTSPLSGAPAVAKAQAGFASVPWNTAQIPFEIGIPLYMGGAAPRVRRTYYQSRFDAPSLVTQVVVSVPYGWWTPLSTAPPVARAKSSDFASVPFYTPAAIAGIAGMAWFTPLWSVPMRNLVAPPGDSFVPFNTIQAAVTTTPRRKPLLFIANVGRLMN